jgi:hypothetical protein
VTDACGAQRSGDAEVEIRGLPEANLPNVVRACEGSTVTITAELAGAAPFIVRWSDGVVQANVQASRVSRNVLVRSVATSYGIDSVTDAFCTNEDIRDRVQVIADRSPVIDSQSHTLAIKSGQTATLSVTTAATAVDYQWFQGAVGDTTRPVGTSAAAFTTPALTSSTLYWVRLTTSCGEVQSAQMTVSVSSKRRTLRH